MASSPLKRPTPLWLGLRTALRGGAPLPIAARDLRRAALLAMPRGATGSHPVQDLQLARSAQRDHSAICGQVNAVKLGRSDVADHAKAVFQRTAQLLVRRRQQLLIGRLVVKRDLVFQLRDYGRQRGVGGCAGFGELLQVGEMGGESVVVG